MKTSLLRLLCIIALGCVTLPAWAWVSSHGREPINCSGWSESLAAVINHPARVCGEIGPVGPRARFYFSGDAAVLNGVLSKYATVSGRTRVLYLEALPAPAVAGFKDGELHDFDVSINQSGQGFVHLYTMGRIRLEDLKIPSEVSVEQLPVISQPIDPEARAKQEAEAQRVAAFLAARRNK